MVRTVNSLQCDYFRSHTTPHVFASERAELVHINEQLSSLDNHISHLNTLQNALHRHSCQLQNLLSLVCTLPVEVLSSIFKNVMDSATFYGPLGQNPYRQYLSQALVLSSVTTHFRYVALGTPELWKKIPLALHDTGPEAIVKASALLQHCLSQASNVDVSIYDKLRLKGQVRSAIDILLTYDTTRKIKVFRLYLAYAPKLWIERLKVYSTPSLETLAFDCERWKNVGSVDLGTIHPITRFEVTHSPPAQADLFIIPPSLQHLKTTDVRQQLVVSLLYQCPSLVECTIKIGNRYLLDGTQFTRPLNLNRLKSLTLGLINVLETNLSLQNFQLPSLENLEIELSQWDKSLGVISFCHNVSTTLTTLSIQMVPDILGYGNLYQLCRLRFPKLRELEFREYTSSVRSSLSSVIGALTPKDDESSTFQSHMFPSLNYLSLFFNPMIEPYILLDMLKKWRVGETSSFQLKMWNYSNVDETWSPELRKELRLVVGSRQVEVTCNRRKIW